MTSRVLAILFARVCMVAACMAAAQAARADTVAYGAQLTGKNESPPNDSAGSGKADMRFDTETRELFWAIDYKDLTGDAIGAHIHGSASPGTNAGVLIPFRDAASPIKGSIKLTDTQAEALEGGKLYVNIHTQKHPGGELRGQLIKE